MAKLMKLFTPEQHKEILSKHPDNKDAAAAYSKRCGESISRQLVRYWREVYEDNNGKKAAADRVMREQVQLLQPSPEDDIGDLSHVPQEAKCILVIPDLHAPYMHPDALAFLATVAEKAKPDLVVQLGDETDGHAISFHDSDPNLDSAGVELEKAKRMLEGLHRIFPELLVCDSNHGSLIYRRAKAHGLPVQYIKKYRDVLFPEHGAPSWSWRSHWKIQTPLGTVLFKHQSSGPVLSDAAHEGCNVCVGHMHGNFEVEYAASSTRLYWGMTSGCLIDRKSMAFAYGKNTKNKPMLGCSLIVEGKPTLIPMVLDDSGRWVGKL